MKKLLVFVGLFVFPSICFAQISLELWPAPGVTQANYYAEYSFADTSKIDEAEIYGSNGWRYNYVFHWTAIDIQNRMNDFKQTRDSDGVSFAFRRTAAEFMSRMLNASADKRIFIIDTSVESGPCGWLFIKINENEYVVFYTGQ